MTLLRDRRGRPLSDLRISVTDRCNFRCRYCMPREHYGKSFRFLPKAELLGFEEIATIARVFANLGVRKLRLTGGEPLLRAELPRLIEQLGDIPGAEVALTTNGSRLERLAADLASAGLHRVTVSLDALDDTVFRQMNDTDCSVADVLAGIEAAARAGLHPIKINTVVQRGVNEHTIVDLARHFRGTGHILRFIEYMDVGMTNGWDRSRVVSGDEIVERISREVPLEPLEPNYQSEVARRFRYRDGSGEIGVITSVTAPFCGSCSRARLSSEGQLYTCLFSAVGTDLRGPLRAGASEQALTEIVATAWQARDDRYSELRALSAGKRRIEMSYIGG